MEKNKMEWNKIKDSSEALKNICTLALYLVLIVFFIVIVWPKVRDFEVTKITIGGVELSKREQAAVKTVDALPTNVSAGKDSAVTSAALFTAAKIVDTLNLSDQSWIYLGQNINGHLTGTNFHIRDIPMAGDVITARNPVYKRSEIPVELKNGDWKLGRITGVVGSRESVKIIAVQEIADHNFWALIQ